MTDVLAAVRARARLIVVVTLALSVGVFLVHAVLARPRLWPAGAGLTLSGDLVFASLAEPRAIPRIRPPDAGEASTLVTVTHVEPGSEAARAGLFAGTVIRGFRTASGEMISLADGLPESPADVLRVWREAYRLGTTPDVVLMTDTEDAVTLARPPVWSATAPARSEWLARHLGPLVQMAAFLAGAVALVALGTHGVTAALMTLALIVTGIANGGPLLGAERSVPVAGDLLLLFGWLVTPLAFPIIGLAVLHFPTRAVVLDRHRWIYPALAAAATPMFVISLASALFLLGVDAVLPPLGWIAAHGWTYDASFALALAANVAIVVEGIGRYRSNPDVNERRRIQIVVFTGVPAVFAYAIRTGIPLLSQLAGRPLQLPWGVEALLLAIVLLPAFGLPYAVAVRHVFSPRTVLRRSLQYALARRTLSLLGVLPIATLVWALLAEGRPLAEIVLGQPLLYGGLFALAAIGLRYRDRAQRWLDQRFFRAEYDAREILVSLAGRVPYETDPRELVAMVLTQIDTALHPEAAAVLAGEDEQLETVSALRTEPTRLARSSGLITLLRWSDEPLELFLDDERSPAARLPQPDRLWIAETRAVLLVPISTGAGEARTLMGVLALGQKKSEEPYTTEDRRLLSGIAAQMSVALDLTRLRRRASATGAATAVGNTLASPTVVFGAPAPPSAPAIGMCPTCRRCFDLSARSTLRCPDDDVLLEPVAGIPAVVDGKYRVDAVVGRGGMGAVFRARDLRLDRDVAIKIVRVDLVADPEPRTRFRREAQIVARLQHPAIVTVFDYGNLADGSAFIVMEYVRGEDLRQVLTRERALAPRRAIDLITGIAMGVEAAHQAGVLHRDLKPENVLLPASGAGPKVLDFGVAKIADATPGDAGFTQGATIVGTPAYMAPEQLRGDRVDGRADVYSLGVMTFEALTGTLPFGTGSFIDIGVQQARGPDAIGAGALPAAIAPAVMSALSLKREERPASPAVFASALRL